jgi:hypothetical protein
MYLLCVICFIIPTGEGLNSFCKIFSFIESIKALLKYDKDNELNALYGFKVLTMLAVLLGHRLFYLLGNPMSNPKLVESVSHKIIYILKLTRN